MREEKAHRDKIYIRDRGLAFEFLGFDNTSFESYYTSLHNYTQFEDAVLTIRHYYKDKIYVIKTIATLRFK